MNTMSMVFTETEHVVDLPMQPWAYGLIALVVFAILAFVLFSYRDVANRHSKSDAAGEHASEAGEPGLH